MKGNHVEIVTRGAYDGGQGTTEHAFENASLRFSETQGMFVVMETGKDGSLTNHFFPAAHVLRASETKA